jgi:hypothetical protein
MVRPKFCLVIAQRNRLKVKEKIKHTPKEENVKMLKGVRYLWLVAAVAAVMTIAGCSGDTPLAPTSDQGQELARTMPVLPAVASDVAVAAVTYIPAAVGGTIAVDKSGYTHEFDIPARAVSSDQVISVSVKEDKIGDRNAIVFEFGPDGLVFNTPSQLKCAISEINARATSGKLYYYDPKVGDWILQGDAPVVDGVVDFNIYHFSKYAISD